MQIIFRSSVCEGNKIPFAGEDKKVCFWDTEKWKLAGTSKPLPKGSVAKVLFSGHGAAAFGDEPFLLLASLVRRPSLIGDALDSAPSKLPS